MKEIKVPDLQNLRVFSKLSFFFWNNTLNTLTFLCSHTFPVGSSRELSWYPKFWEQNVHNTITFAEWSLRILWTNNGIKNIYPKGSFKNKKYILSPFLDGLFSSLPFSSSTTLHCYTTGIKATFHREKRV